MTEFDPTRAKPETVAAALKLADVCNRFNEGPHDGGEYEKALRAYRATLPKLRTRAEVDAEIANEVRLSVARGYDEDCFYAQCRQEEQRVGRIRELCTEETTDSGPSSVDTDDGGISHPPASVPVSPAGAAYSPAGWERRSDEMWWHQSGFWIIRRRGGDFEIQHDSSDTHALLRAQDASVLFGPPGAAAAKESSDTTAAAPEGAALEDPEPCGCEEAEALVKRIERARDVIRKWNFFGNASARQFADEIRAALAGEPWP